MPRVIIGVMGPHVAGNTDMETHSFELGAEIGKHGYVLLTGGRNSGVMDAASRGAKSVGALVIGVLPSDNTDELSSAVDIPIITGLQSARNNINVLSSAVIISVGMGPGTASELCLALKANKPIILLDATSEAKAFFNSLAPTLVTSAETVQEAIQAVLALAPCELKP